MNELDLINIERDLVAEKGMAQFTRVAWPHVEPGRLLWNWHIDAVAEHLQAVTALQIRQLLILVPPGTMKSLLTGVMWPAWEWGPGKKPETKWLYGSYGRSLALKSAKQHRDLVLSDWYQKRWGDICSINRTNSRLLGLFDNVQKGMRFSTAVGGEATGRHGDRIVFDDLVKAQDATGRAAFEPAQIEKANEFWTKTMATRASSPDTVTRVGVMQRLHHNDTAAICKEQGYEVLELPMEYDGNTRVTSIGFRDPRKVPGKLLWPKRMGKAFVANMKKSLLRDYWAQYQQVPTPPDGIEIKDSWIKHWGEPGSAFQTIRGPDFFWFQSWDLARKDKSTSDYVVGQTWASDGINFFLIDQTRDRWDYMRSVDEIRAFRAKWPQVTEIVIEDAANGTAAINELNKELPGIIGVTPTKAKEIRLRMCAPLFKSGHVYWPPRTSNVWVESLRAEVLGFPNMKHDDQLDCMTQALNHHNDTNQAYAMALRKLANGR